MPKGLSFLLATIAVVFIFWIFIHTRTDVYNRYTTPQNDTSAGARDIQDVAARKYREAMLRAAAAVERGNIAEANRIVDEAKISRDEVQKLIAKAADVPIPVVPINQEPTPPPHTPTPVQPEATPVVQQEIPQQPTQPTEEIPTPFVKRTGDRSFRVLVTKTTGFFDTRIPVIINTYWWIASSTPGAKYVASIGRFRWFNGQTIDGQGMINLSVSERPNRSSAWLETDHDARGTLQLKLLDETPKPYAVFDISYSDEECSIYYSDDALHHRKSQATYSWRESVLTTLGFDMVPISASP